MTLVFGTVVRSAPVRQGGRLVRLDWERKQIEAEVPVVPVDPSTEHDPNPRGNSRGCRGIFFYGDSIVAANYHTLSFYDQQLRLQRSISNHLMVGLHEVAYNGNGRVWVTSTSIDAALEVDLETGDITRALWPREMPPIQQRFRVAPLDIDKGADNRLKYMDATHTRHPSHLHLNAVAEWDGEVYALFHAFGAVADLSSGHVVIEDDALHGGHNLVVLDDGTAVLNDSFGQTIRFYDLSTGHLRHVIDLMDYSWVRSLRRIARVRTLHRRAAEVLRRGSSPSVRPLFVRGLDVRGDRLYVGVSPASILCIDWKRNELVDAYRYATDPAVCVHGLKVLDE